MAWCRQATTSCYLSQYWLRSVLPYGITRPQWVNVRTWKTRIHTSYIVSTVAADDLATYVARASAAMVLTWCSWNIPASAPEGLRLLSFDSNFIEIFGEKNLFSSDEENTIQCIHCRFIIYTWNVFWWNKLVKSLSSSLFLNVCLGILYFPGTFRQ